MHLKLAASNGGFLVVVRIFGISTNQFFHVEATNTKGVKEEIACKKTTQDAKNMKNTIQNRKHIYIYYLIVS